VRKILTSLRRAASRVAGKGEPAALASRRILFVCMGNICRSPTAEGVLRKLLLERAPELDVAVASAGTHAYHVGSPPDQRACRAAERRGVDLRAQRARQVSSDDFERHELVLAMDVANRQDLVSICPPQFHERIRLFLEFAPQLGRTDVPDPYYGGNVGFEHVLDLVEEASVGLIEYLRATPAARALDAQAAEGQEGAPG
jgi:low molecular weight protein-tyrosine phosphatase